MPKASLTPTVSAIESAIPSMHFDIDPESAQWAYSLKVNTVDTYGGRVIQVLSRSIDSLSVKGHLPCRKGLDVSEYESQFGNMERFERGVRAVAEQPVKSKGPRRFNFPALEWSEKAWLTDMETFGVPINHSLKSHWFLNTRHFRLCKSEFVRYSQVYHL